MHKSKATIPMLAATGLLLVIGSAQAEIIYGLTSDNTLFNFDSATPNDIDNGAFITGLNATETVIGIDFRPSNGQLYGLTNQNRIFTIGTTPSVNFGTATFVSTLSAPLNGTSFGIDFNPVPNLLRVISDADQNLRVNVDTGATTVDGPITYGTNVNPNIVGAAYSNNVAGATSTTLYTIDSFLNQLNTQNPPNNGTQVPVGSLTVDTTNLVGFDISGVTGTAYASLQPAGGGFSQLYSINLVNGIAQNANVIGGGLFVRDISVMIPEPATLGLAALAAAGLVARRRRA
ncbi:MAG TPA: DUF4394 domain-containing protein [Tepidisphaeraceae bacterium]|jgi:hypothetical protein